MPGILLCELTGRLQGQTRCRNPSTTVSVPAHTGRFEYLTSKLSASTPSSGMLTALSSATTGAAPGSALLEAIVARTEDYRNTQNEGWRCTVGETSGGHRADRVISYIK